MQLEVAGQRETPHQSYTEYLVLAAFAVYQIRGLQVPVLGHGFRIGDALMGVFALYMMFRLVRSRRYPTLPIGLWVAAIAIPLTAVLSFANAVNLVAAVSETIRMIFVAVVTVSLVYWAQEKGYRWDSLAKIAVLVAAFLSVLGIIGAVLFSFGIRTPLVHDTLELRINPLFNDPNHFAHYVGTVLFLNLWLALRSHQSKLWLGTLALNLVGLILTLSCSGLFAVSGAAVLVLGGAVLKERRLAVPALVVLLIVGFAGVGLCGSSLISRAPQLIRRIQSTFLIQPSTASEPNVAESPQTLSPVPTPPQGVIGSHDAASNGQSPVTEPTAAEPTDGVPGDQPGAEVVGSNSSTTKNVATPSNKGLGSIRKYSAASSLGDRADLWAAAYRGFMAHPVVGLGADNFKYRYEDFRSPTSRLGGIHAPHNTYLKVMSEQGVLGLVAFATLLGSAAWTLLRVRAFDAGTPLRLCVLGAFVVSIIQAAALDVLTSRTLWLAILFTMSTNMVREADF